jgi:transcriptional regulator with XRE-family HTH domain
MITALLTLFMKIAITIDLPELEKELKTWRDAKGLSLNDLSRQITLGGKSITSQHIQRIETSGIKVVPYETLKTICDAMGLDLMPQIAAALQAQILQGRSQ